MGWACFYCALGECQHYPGGIEHNGAESDAIVLALTQVNGTAVCLDCARMASGNGKAHG